ncbi:MAG TPA: DUF2958 domain-containing protein [Stellaceae bacterium]|jgi:hypothetical protein|nr:DUF2958 domain-containing protein [Stellaceae bacterium]
MYLFTKAQFGQLLANGRDRDQDHLPVVKLFTPDANCTWLLSEVDPEERDIAFGLYDLGQGFPELGCVSLAELRSVRGKLGLAIERDLSFTAEHPLSVYAKAARQADRITEDSQLLLQAAAALFSRSRS